LACGGSAAEANLKTYLYLSYSDQDFGYKSGRFRQLELKESAVVLGNSFPLGAIGFRGKIREFILANTFVEQLQVKQIRN